MNDPEYLSILNSADQATLPLVGAEWREGGKKSSGAWPGIEPGTSSIQETLTRNHTTRPPGRCWWARIELYDYPIPFVTSDASSLTSKA